MAGMLRPTQQERRLSDVCAAAATALGAAMMFTAAMPLPPLHPLLRRPVVFQLLHLLRSALVRLLLLLLLLLSSSPRHPW